VKGGRKVEGAPVESRMIELGALIFIVTITTQTDGFV